ncbi:hypothetical protein [Patulibacter defluvii]|uniref:hypothetical protein n=1 Tax=Patulibacter defluvii TaxID=3095358 RepID=UPI002A74C197|nr:hypothetical protein [Patulibacter sp. DM4]
MRVSVPRRPTATAALAAVVAALPAVALPASADAASLSLAKGRATITRSFHQELAWAPGTALDSRVFGCRRASRSTVTCRTEAALRQNGATLRCSKRYRARRTARGVVTVAQSRDGRHWRRSVQSRCVRI